MLKIHEIREIIRLIDQSTISELEIEGEGTRLSLKKNSVVAANFVAEQPQIVTPLVQPTAAPKAIEPKPSPAASPAPAALSVVKEAAAAVQETVSIEQDLHKIVSPMVGTFYCAPEVDAAPYVKVGDRVENATVVCIVEAMKLFNEIEAEVKGTITKVLVENGQLVEYGQPLFLVKPE
jgi:acetyl-CoA carboxylase biotin carboxyl carrier protein